jgi:ABC-2 type transport system permease protein
MVALAGLVRKDLLLFFNDRRSVIVSFVVPIAIASFFGSIFSGPSTRERARIAVIVVDEDRSAISQAIVVSAEADANLSVSIADESTARERVRRGTIPVAVVVPHGFGDAAGAAFFGSGEKPQLGIEYDPSRSMDLAMVRGIFTEHVMHAVSGEMFGGAQGRAYLEKTRAQLEGSNMDARQKELLQLLRSVQRLYDQPSNASAVKPMGLTLPYTVREEPVTSGTLVSYNGYAHAFAGMGIQFLLFAMANLGVEMLLERQRGLWRRLRSAPVSRFTLLAARVVSGAIISLLILGVCFAFAMAVFRVRIDGSFWGFAGVALACAVMASTFGVLVAALGNTPATARGVTTLAVLMLVMLGGAWVPTFVFPAWLQRFTVVLPVRWAVDGLDAMTWRGIGASGAVFPIIVLVAFAAAFAAIAALRFRWEEQ